MPYAYIMELTKHWIIAHGFALAILVIIGFLIPRIGRRIIDGMSHAIDEDTEASKGRKAIIGAIVYIAEAIAYAALIITAMHNLGINLAAAAIPATVVSAAVGFGSQKSSATFSVDSSSSPKSNTVSATGSNSSDPQPPSKATWST